MEINTSTLNIHEKQIEKKITKKTKAILAVNMYGGVCDLKKLKKICQANKLFLIEDCAESMIARDENNYVQKAIDLTKNQNEIMSS